MVWGLFSPRNWRGAAAWATHILPGVQREGASRGAPQVKYCQEEERSKTETPGSPTETTETGGAVYVLKSRFFPFYFILMPPCWVSLGF